ncbi:MAG: GatB/YqeY domain-containing protein [Pseudomonadota bacterium]
MRERISAAMREAEQAGDATRVATLRLMAAAIRDRDLAARAGAGCAVADDVAVLELVERMIRQREAAARAYEEGGRLELAERERAEVAVIRTFLPRPMTEAEISHAVEGAIAELGARGIRDVGRVMAWLKERYMGRLDFGQAGVKVRAALGG